jgi:RAB protein geranylgeranyltransferase component A
LFIIFRSDSRGVNTDETIPEIDRTIWEWSVLGRTVRRCGGDSTGVLSVRPWRQGHRLINRACAVFGGTYVLGKESIPESITVEEGSVKLKLPCHPRVITAKRLVTSPDHLPADLRRSGSSTSTSSVTAHCVALISSLPVALRRPKTIKESEGEEEVDADDEDEDDTAVIVFPPTEDGALVRALVMGEGTGSCPSGQCKPSPRNP